MSQNQYNRQQVGSSTQESADYWKKRAHCAEDKIEELATERCWMQAWVANPNIRDKEKVGGVAYYEYYQGVKPREDGKRYYSLVAVAKLLGNVRIKDEHGDEKQGKKEQSFAPTHTLFIKSGLINSVREPQKNNPKRYNLFDEMTPQWVQNPGGVVLAYGEKAKNIGGPRVALHRECGGVCLVNYTCMKCGEVRIPEENILTLSAEKWEKWKEDAREAQEWMAALAEEMAAEPEIEAVTPPVSAPNRDCYVCSYRYGFPVQAWKWDLREGRWACANEAEHDLPKIGGSDNAG